MFYKVNKQITNIYDGQPLRIIGNVGVYNDENKTQLFTELPFTELGINVSFSECPHGSKEEFNKFIEDKVLEAINKEDIQNKLKEVKQAFELGILK